MSPVLLWNTFLLSGITRGSRLILYLPGPSPAINHFSKKPCFLLVENGIRDQDLGSECAHGYWCLCFLALLWTELRTIYIHTHLRIYIHTYTYFRKWIHSYTSNFSPFPQVSSSLDSVFYDFQFEMMIRQNGKGVQCAVGRQKIETHVKASSLVIRLGCHPHRVRRKSSLPNPKVRER